MDEQKFKETNQKAKKSGMDEDRARYLDIEQMVKRELQDAERVLNSPKLNLYIFLRMAFSCY